MILVCPGLGKPASWRERVANRDYVPSKTCAAAAVVSCQKD